eukprot:5261568-Prymnesium_polylepis.1
MTPFERSTSGHHARRSSRTGPYSCDASMCNRSTVVPRRPKNAAASVEGAGNGMTCGCTRWCTTFERNVAAAVEGAALPHLPRAEPRVDGEHLTGQPECAQLLGERDRARAFPHAHLHDERGPQPCHQPLVQRLQHPPARDVGRPHRQVGVDVVAAVDLLVHVVI